MEQPAVKKAQAGEVLGQSTLTIEERVFDYRAPGGQDYKFFLVVRT